ncbi:YcnI family protein [Paenibacillus humicola]|uniref:YcnI family copper-binding membrane protein n=1 Tax=Paenibacillus humicola TaxID=3110540 RepID=UPI00237B99BC|nr:YcnI family protein [Paenibacillus humicola]
MILFKKWTVPAAALLSLVLFAGIASAHVSVQPAQTTQGAYEVFSVRVPSEEENVTTKSVKVTVPSGVSVTRVEPHDGWKVQLDQNEDGSFKTITWTAEGAGLAQTEFTDFRMQGRVADNATQLVWKAYQTYSDGKVVEWTGAPDADHPASVTTVEAAVGGDPAQAAGEAAGGSDAKENAALVLAIAGVVLGAAALVLAAVKRRRA